MKILRPIAFAVAALLCAGAIGATTAAYASPACAPAAETDAHLRDRYAEAPVGHGITSGRLVMLYAASDGTTWTVAVVDPRNGLMCILAAGESWEELPRQRRPPGDPS